MASRTMFCPRCSTYIPENTTVCSCGFDIPAVDGEAPDVLDSPPPLSPVPAPAGPRPDAVSLPSTRRILAATTAVLLLGIAAVAGIVVYRKSTGDSRLPEVVAITSTPVMSAATALPMPQPAAAATATATVTATAPPATPPPVEATSTIPEPASPIPPIAAEAPPAESASNPSSSGFDAKPIEVALLPVAVDSPGPNDKSSSVGLETSAMAGTWEGQVEQPGYRPYSVLLDLEDMMSSQIGTAIGTIRYASLKCSGALRIVSRGNGRARLKETIDSGRCKNSYIRVIWDDPNTLHLTWTDTAGNEEAAGIVSRRSPH